MNVHLRGDPAPIVRALDELSTTLAKRSQLSAKLVAGLIGLLEDRGELAGLDLVPGPAGTAEAPAEILDRHIAVLSNDGRDVQLTGVSTGRSAILPSAGAVDRMMAVGEVGEAFHPGMIRRSAPVWN